MAATSTVHPLLLIDHFIETVKGSSLRTAFLRVRFLFILYTVYVVGRALHLMHEFGVMHARETSRFQKEDTIWPMLDFHHARSSLFHTEVCAITLLSGAVQISGTKITISLIQIELSSILQIQGLRTRRNYSIYAIHPHAMLLNVFLVF
jgi:hypothetical protein